MGITVYYWPMLARGGSLVRMLEHTGTPYTYISDRAKMAALASSFGSTAGDTFAPPILVDDDFTIGQSTATCLYLGKKLGLTPPGYNEFKALQFCMDIVDTFEGNLGKNNEQGPALKAFLEGPRFAALMGNLERAIKGPYYFGEEPSAVDFFLLAHLDWRIAQVFEPLKALGIDCLAPYTKVVKVGELLRATDGYKNYKGGLQPASGPLKDEILAAFK